MKKFGLLVFIFALSIGLAFSTNCSFGNFKDLSGIHSFDYISLQSEIDLRGFLGKQVFLGGTLKKVEFNDRLDDKNPWVMYLIFEKGTARVVDDK